MPKTTTGLEPQKKQVQIIRKEGSSHVPPEVRQTSIHRLGSVYVQGSPHKGVEDSVEKLLLPLINDIPASSEDFRKEAKDFWRSLTVKVPSEGTVLNLNVDEEGYPEDPKDYLIGIWAETHPYVAKSKKEMEDSGKKKFYIHDPDRETKSTNKKVKAKASAYKEFVKVIDDEKSVNRILRVLGNSNPDGMSKEQKENALHKLMDADPVKFEAVATDDNLPYKDFIAELISYEILRQSGNTYFYMDEAIGGSLDEAVSYLKDKKNSSVLNDLKAKLEERKKVS